MGREREREREREEGNSHEKFSRWERVRERLFVRPLTPVSEAKIEIFRL